MKSLNEYLSFVFKSSNSSSVVIKPSIFSLVISLKCSCFKLFNHFHSSSCFSLSFNLTFCSYFESFQRPLIEFANLNNLFWVWFSTAIDGNISLAISLYYHTGRIGLGANLIFGFPPYVLANYDCAHVASYWDNHPVWVPLNTSGTSKSLSSPSLSS